MGPLWLDVEGFEIDAVEKEILAHPTVGGVILFARNYHDNEQLLALNKSIRAAAKRPILIGVDQEGGRVQRFRDGFTAIPAAKDYANMLDGVNAAKMGGWLMAAELIAHDIDLSFAPVLDKTFQCKAIGNRAFGEDLATILKYSSAYMQGMKQVGMATTGKHFPGHGGVVVDSHYETPFDQRDDIFETDMAIFKAQIEAGILDAMMPAHVVYPNYDDQPASGSSYWLKKVLRDQLGFEGIVFSDDLNMEGASIMGGPAERSLKSMQAGCDMVLMCNNRKAAIEVLDNLPITEVPQAMSLLKQQSFSLNELQSTPEWQQAHRVMNAHMEQKK
ncbi:MULTISPECIES: beta-N-acetylhexosaminidase [Vibrio]|uniref:Beta-hexosaminidase n=1 Tax=Vibrio algicola TaxID=2662262 RepID=A0A5Q0TJ62_9VIBR|nr:MULTISPECIES: beta-N-acetylhexosaminidase [Vibrio]MBD1577821.1 beta-N-acetylhexosaminidase [Vibrio sp. S11_S32]